MKHSTKISIVLASLALAFVLFATANAQHLPPCFCCDQINVSQLTPNPPPINGPDPICPCPPITFTTVECPGAVITWTVVAHPSNTSVTFTQPNPSTITLTLASLPTGTTSVTITVKISCGHSVIQNQKTIKIKETPKACFAYSITADGNGGYIVTATSQGGSAPDAWRFTEITTPTSAISNCNAWGYGSIIPGCSPSGYFYEGPGPLNWTSSSPTCTLLSGHTYRIIHWVEKCSKTWEASDCRALCWVCFTITQVGHMKTPAKGSKVPLENVSEGVQINAPTPEMMKGSK